MIRMCISNHGLKKKYYKLDFQQKMYEAYNLFVFVFLCVCPKFTGCICVP